MIFGFTITDGVITGIEMIADRAWIGECTIEAVAG
jgi:hypothetical protein